jgi:hypothetical protein
MAKLIDTGRTMKKIIDTGKTMTKLIDTGRTMITEGDSKARYKDLEIKEKGLQEYVMIDAGQRFDSIGKNIAHQIRVNCTRDIKYERVGESDKYETWVSHSSPDERIIGNMVPIDSAKINDLESIFRANVYNPNNLPKEIRVVRPNFHRNLYTVFFSVEEKE